MKKMTVDEVEPPKTPENDPVEVNPPVAVAPDDGDF